VEDVNVPRIMLEDERDFLVYRDGSGPTVEILDIVVGTERRRGKGRRLVSILLRDRLSPKINLVYAITRTDNFISQQFWESLGFRVVGVLRHFYQDKEDHDTVDAIMYGLDIKHQKEEVK
jgi:ribosomal protein S18 acetylase RimI-like enzyme